MNKKQQETMIKIGELLDNFSTGDRMEIVDNLHHITFIDLIETFQKYKFQDENK